MSRLQRPSNDLRFVSASGLIQSPEFRNDLSDPQSVFEFSASACGCWHQFQKAGHEYFLATDDRKLANSHAQPLAQAGRQQRFRLGAEAEAQFEPIVQRVAPLAPAWLERQSVQMEFCTMPSDLKAVSFIADHSGLGTRLGYKRMFGEYALYLNTKVVAFVCDNKLFLKPTEAGRALLGSPTEAPAYPGSKNYFLLEEELEDALLLRRALEITEDSLPFPKSKPTPTNTPKPGKRAKPRAAA